MKDSFYFPHDYHARHDPKLERLRVEIGPVGDGIYWDIVEMLYEEGGSLLIQDIPLIAKSLNTSTELVTKVVKDSTLFSLNGKRFYSKSLLQRLKHINAKRKKAKDNAKKRWGKLKNPKRGLIFYVIRVWDKEEEFLKIGITAESVSRRFSGKLLGYQYEILFSDVLSQSVAFAIENVALKECKKYTPSQRIPGYLECYSIAEKDKILAIIQRHMPTHSQRSAIKESKVKESKVYKRESKRENAISDLDFLNALKKDPLYVHINFDIELQKMDRWLERNPGRKKTRRFIINWLNRIERPVDFKTRPEPKPDPACDICQGKGKIPDGPQKGAICLCVK